MENIAKIMTAVNCATNLSFRPVEPHSPYFAVYRGEDHSHRVLEIGFPESFPYKLPDVFVRYQQRMYLHVDDTGKICLANLSSLLFDNNNLPDLVVELLARAEEILNLKVGTDKYNIELRKEFLSYWGVQEGGFSIWSISDVSTDVSIQEAKLIPCKNSYIVSPSFATANCLAFNTFGIELTNTHIRPVWIIRLTEGSLLPSPYKRYDWSDIVKYIKNNTEQSTWKEFLRITSTPVKKEIVCLILVLPSDNENGGDIVFGVIVCFANEHKLPMNVSKTEKVIPTHIIRLDYDYLLSRCTGSPSLKDKRVLLLGCGSVGGFLANNLCQLGITQLDLLDKDYLSSENVHRHFLGFESINSDDPGMKADIMRTVLTNKYPYVEIDSLNYRDRSVEKVFLNSPNRLQEYDLIISALGEPTLNLAINELLITHHISTPFMVCFNEPFGIGGHVISVNLDRGSCLRCLYSDINYGTLCTFRASLVAPDQEFAKTLSGCSGYFVPYSCLDAQQTALCAARKAVEILTGRLMHNDLYTWRGDPTLLKSQGYQLSSFYDNDSAPSNLSNPSCPVCRERGV